MWPKDQSDIGGDLDMIQIQGSWIQKILKDFWMNFVVRWSSLFLDTVYRQEKRENCGVKTVGEN